MILEKNRGKTLKLAIFLLLSVLSLPVSANVVGTGAQNFNSITSGLDFVTVQSSETLRPGLLNFGFFLNYAVNSLPYFENIPQGRTEFNDGLLGADLNFGLGLMKNWDMGVSLPFILAQTVTANTAFRGEFSKVGVTEIRLNSKYRLIGDNSRGVAVIGSVNFNLMENNPYKGSPANPTLNLEVAGDMTFGRVAVGLNLGHRWMFPGPAVSGAPLNPFGNQMIVSTAASYHLPKVDTKLVTEIFGSIPLERTSSDQNRSASSLEWIVGAKHDLSQKLAFHAGLGTQMLNGLSSPDWRVYTGINYVMGPVFSKDQSSVVIRADTKIILQNILFEFDSDNIVGEYKTVLDVVMEYVRMLGNYQSLVVEGHTDSIGNAQYNQYLSQKRAERIRKVIIDSYGVKPEKIRAEGYGPDQPIADNGNFQGRQENRRVEIRVER